MSNPNLSEDLLLDAPASLAQAMRLSSIQFNAKGLKAMAFMRVYAGQPGAELGDYIYGMKFHQSPFAMKRMMDAMRSATLFDFFKGVAVNLGGKQ